MIIILLGGVGSGKTLTAVKEIVDNKQFALTNFKLRNIKNYHRIKVSDIIKKNKENKLTVNWDFWEKIRNKYKNYSIYLDEIHNIIHARRSMSKMNILMSKWVSQIRKILADKPNNHLYIISQTQSKIDGDFRDLAQIIIWCKKIEIGKKVYIIQFWYDGIKRYQYSRKTLTTRFLGNKYFKYFKSRDLVTFTDAEEYL